MTKEKNIKKKNEKPELRMYFLVMKI